MSDRVVMGEVSRLSQSPNSSTKKRWEAAYVCAALVACAMMLTIAARGGFWSRGDQQHLGFLRHWKAVVGERFEHGPEEGSGITMIAAEGGADASRMLQVVNLDDREDGLSRQEYAKAVAQHGENEGGTGVEPETLHLPQCYSSPSADPSKGAWAKCENGVNESPVDMVNWNYPRRHFVHNARCSSVWARQHPNEGPMPYFEWQPQECWLEKVDAAKFCHVMEGRKGLLFVGDSLSRQMTTTLASILRAKSIVAAGNERCHDEWLACSDTLKVTFQRNDLLDTRTAKIPGVKGTNCVVSELVNAQCTVFADDDTLKGYDTVVVNSGAHRDPSVQYGPAMEVASKAIAASMRRLHSEDDVILVVRNTAPGHWECNERMFQGPVELEVALRLNANGKYNWSGYRGDNEQLKQAFLGSPEDGWKWLDVYTPTVLRADSHMGGEDCLHYCIPGPTDHWVRLLYNLLVDATANSRGGE